MSYILFNDREDAGRRLAERLKELPLKAPLVLAIPRGGIETAAPIARALGAELDVVLSRKLRAPDQPELAIGAVTETGEVCLNAFAGSVDGVDDGYIERERLAQLAEIKRRSTMFRAVRPQAVVANRSVIVTDDGIATGATMIAALRTVRAAGPAEIVLAVPVAAPDRLRSVARLCDHVVCLYEPRDYMSVGQHYRSFDQVSDDRVVALLQDHVRQAIPVARPAVASGLHKGWR